MISFQAAVSKYKLYIFSYCEPEDRTCCCIQFCPCLFIEKKKWCTMFPSPRAVSSMYLCAYQPLRSKTDQNYSQLSQVSPYSITLSLTRTHSPSHKYPSQITERVTAALILTHPLHSQQLPLGGTNGKTSPSQSQTSVCCQRGNSAVCFFPLGISLKNAKI